MKEIKDDNFVTIQGWVVTQMHLTSDEAIIYALVYGYPNHSCAESLMYFAQWIGKSARTTQRILRHLVSAGCLEEDVQAGKATVYRCVPPSKCHPIIIII